MEFTHPVPAQNRRLYVGNSIADDITVIDLDSLKVLGKLLSEIKLTGRPNPCAVTPEGRYVAVPIRDGDSGDYRGGNPAKSCEDLARQSSAQRL